MQQYLISFLFIFISFFYFTQKDSTFKLNTSVQLGNEFVVDYKTPKEYELGPIRVEGVDNFDHNTIKLISGLRQGLRVMIPGEKITKAINNLWDEGVFSNVEISVEKELMGIVYLVIKLEARPKLSRYKFNGINKREADKIREEIDLFSGRTITENLVFTTSNKIKGYFREKGYYNVSVNIKRNIDTLINESEYFYISINKGKKVGIKTIEIEGVSSIPMWKLKMAMKDTKQKAPWRIFKRSKFTNAGFERDKEALLNKFYAIGLRDAAITYDTVYLKNPKDLHVKIKVDEGKKYFFGDIDWIGNTIYRSSYLDTVLGIKYGDIYNKSLT
jgi:outer membrane protein insertion porin family